MNCNEIKKELQKIFSGYINCFFIKLVYIFIMLIYY